MQSTAPIAPYYVRAVMKDARVSIWVIPKYVILFSQSKMHCITDQMRCEQLEMFTCKNFKVDWPGISSHLCPLVKYNF